MVPLMVNGVFVLAHRDTLSDVSLLDVQFARQHAVLPTPGQTMLIRTIGLKMLLAVAVVDSAWQEKRVMHRISPEVGLGKLPGVIRVVVGNDLAEYCDLQTVEVPKGQFSLSSTGGVGERCWSIDETPIKEPLEMSAQEVQNEEYMRLEFKLYIRENLNIPDTDTCTHPSAVVHLTLIKGADSSKMVAKQRPFTGEPSAASSLIFGGCPRTAQQTHHWSHGGRCWLCGPHSKAARVSHNDGVLGSTVWSAGC